MKTRFSILSAAIGLMLLALTFSCQKDPPKVIPILGTTPATDITSTTATCGGTITDDGGSPVIARGLCWGTNQNPTTLDSKASNGTGIGSFTVTITGLMPGGTYYIRAFATNAIGTAYGNQVTITALSVLPVLATTDLLGISSTAATGGGNITSDGGAAVIARGVCWSRNQNPTTAHPDSTTANGTGTGIFSSSISNLKPGTTYYVRAYATNSVGTAYGNQLTATTTAILPELTTTVASEVAATTATSGGNITYDGGAAITARGVCWNTSDNPTISGSRTVNGTGLGAFTSTITGLAPGTTYYVRAYATNSIGTAYGSQITITSLSVLPTLVTTAASAITATTATSGGNITYDGGAAITARGICWSTVQNPTITDSRTTNSTGTGSFTSSITGLSPGVFYYVRAYATNSAGTAYGNQITFTTDAVIPQLTTIAVSSVTSSTAMSGGNITSDGGAALTARGVCWSTNQSPTVADSRTISGNGTGSFSSSIVGLSPGITYYVRAYATNSIGTAYGNQFTFTTIAVLPTLTTATVNAITSTTAISGGEITSDGGAALTARGVCWSTSENPTTGNSKTNDGTGTGSFTSSVTGLTPGTTYYLRAFAINNAGTAYGNQVAFTTDAVLPTVTTVSVSEITATTATSGGNINYDGGDAITARGICWSTVQNPTIADSRTINGTGTGGFTSSIVELSPHTTYYVRSYATNSAGTAYGNQVSFTTYAAAPTVSTTTVYAIATTSATSGGNVTADGGSAVTARGVCWSTSENPTTGNSKTNDGTGTGSFTSSITGLSISTTYYVRAYATNSIGTSYGAQVTFNTSATTPTLTTAAVTAIGTTTASSGGNISYNGGAEVTARGVCWSTGQSPTTADSHTINGTGSGSFVSNISGLSPGTIYYVRAYATNSCGTAYGNQLVFATSANVPTVTTAAISSITSTSATGGGNVTSDGGGMVTARGVCWSTSQNPTIVNSKTINSTGTGSFVSNISDLLPGTTYYVRAYATNSSGTAYGDQVHFVTTQALAILTTTSVSAITSTTAKSGGNITNDGGNAVVARGVCWSISTDPTISDNKTTDGTGTGSFTSSITGLLPGTTYYVRAYATTSAGTDYGNQHVFTTNAILPEVTTLAATGLSMTTASSGGTVTYDGGAAVTARGVCWSTSPTPTIADSKTADGMGAGSFTSSITGLTKDVTYYIRAYATNSVGTSYGEQISITTPPFNDGTYTVLQTHTMGNGVDLVFMGDGYTVPEVINHDYINDMNEAVMAFFDMEPYKTYRQYFNIYVVYAFSNESGISDITRDVDTRFGTKYTKAAPATNMSTNTTTCFNYANYAPISALSETAIILVANSTRYAGTCIMWSSGQAVAICPTSNLTYPYDFRGVVQHEAGGHCFAKCADEYTVTTGTIPPGEVTTLQTWQGYGYFKNVDVTSNLSTILWSNFIGVAGYSYVGAYEGAYYYTQGVWRPESTSVMINNIKYMNAPCREMAVKRIMSLAGETYSFENFKLHDVMELTVATKSSGMVIDKTRLLAPPILIK